MKDLRQKFRRSLGSTGLLFQTCGILPFLFEELGSKTSDNVYNKTIQPGGVFMLLIQFGLQTTAKQFHTREGMCVFIVIVG
jgi:hypothetical protein